MLNNKVVKPGIVLSVCFAALSVVSGLTSCGGATSSNTSSTPSAPIVLPPAIAAEANKCATALTRGPVYYYCDCKAGAASGCRAGDDNKAGTDPHAPRQTLLNASGLISGWSDNTNHTVALCKGGSFAGAGNYGGGLMINRAGCAAGTDCDDIREYSSPVFTSSAAPLVTESITKVALFSFMGTYGGVRIMNLALKDTTGSHASNAMFAAYNAHDITMCNNTISDFAIAVELAGDETVAPSVRDHIVGNTITGSTNIAILGAASDSDVSYNYFANNGGGTVFNHTIYWSGHVPMTNVNIVGNYIHNTYNPTCAGVVIVAHGELDYFNVTDNTIIMDDSVTTAQCFGIGIGSTAAYTEANYFRHTSVARNTVINGGATAIAVGNAPGAVIEDNLVLSNFAYGGTPGVSQWPIAGISLPTSPSRTSPADDTTTANIVRNNTVWFGPLVLGGALGINTGVEGTGHIIANNTVTYSASTVAGGRVFGCYGFGLSLSSYAAINNNHCYSPAAHSFRVTTDSYGQAVNDSTALSLSDWKTYASSQGWDSASIEGSPNFVNATTSAGYNFKPNTGSPLIGAGSPTYAPTYDLTGTSLFGNPPDIGALTH